MVLSEDGEVLRPTSSRVYESDIEKTSERKCFCVIDGCNLCNADKNRDVEVFQEQHVSLGVVTIRKGSGIPDEGAQVNAGCNISRLVLSNRKMNFS